jgi:predicted MFS family arabinose efflux permease
MRAGSTPSSCSPARPARWFASLAGNGLTFAAGRALIALGTTTGAVTSFKVYAMWFPAERLALANGLSISAGGIGVMLGTLPVELALEFMDWRAIHVIVGAALVLSAGLVLTVVPAAKPDDGGETLAAQIKGLGLILGSADFWRVQPLVMTVLGIYGGLIALWSGPWIRDVAGFDGPGSANVLLLAAGAVIVSGLATGPLSGLALRLGLSPIGFAVATAVLFTGVIFLLAAQWIPALTAVFFLWGAFGFMAPLALVVYAALGAEFPKELNGRLNACLTLSWLLGAFVVQNIYGVVLDQFPAAGAGYAAEGHSLAMAINLGLLVIALAWYFVFSAISKRRRAP